ncbi:MAG: hypothetical protein M0R46_04510 [Candidatus Muirbacterium halophilum]|nr:hypothetical protein [Candidatus Muirbacterium halophilum]MCK9475157.1 hypothetical protein [Candidatus Muirbacterium halophilum]
MHLFNNIYKILKKEYLSILLIILFANLLFLSMPGNFGFLILIIFIPVFYIVEKISIKKSLICGILAGFLAGVLIYRGFTGYGNLIYYYSIFLLSFEFGMFFYLYKKKGIFSAIMFIPFFEYIRTLGPFACPSNIALSVYKIPGIVYYSSFFGIYGVSILILLFNYWLYNIKKYYLYLIILCICFLIPLTFIYNEVSNGKKLNIAVIQGSIPIWMYSMEEFKIKYANSIENVYFELTKKAAIDNDIVIWPETAIHRSLFKKNNLYYREFFKSLNNKYKTDFIVGTSHLEKEVETNSVFYLKNNIEYRYDKIKTVPFVEDFYKKGEVFESIGDENGKISAVICFESAFEDIVRRNTDKNADFIVVNTNDAGFNKTVISYLHSAYSVFRACENKKWLIRAAQSGISMFISPFGVIKSESNLFETCIFSESIVLNKNKQNSLFSSYYYYIILLMIFLFILSVVL